MSAPRIVPYVFLLLLVTTAPTLAQIQPGPNLSPSGRPFLYAPAHGYIGPPEGLAIRPPWRFGPRIMAVPVLPPLPEPPQAPCIVSPYDVGLAPFLNVRASPNGWVVGQLPNGTPVFPTDEFAGNWVFIVAPVQGWVFRPYLACLPPPPPDTASLASPPMAYSEPPAVSAPPPRAAAPAPRLPGRHRPNYPCPDGCPREPDDQIK